ncbi:MAG: succinylglutamate-semialdehyde dehydrogenase [Pseudomonadota bacterium]
MGNGDLYINGTWRGGKGRGFSTINPSTGLVLEDYFSATNDDVNEAVLAARNAFHDWALTPLDARISILQKYKDIIVRDAEGLARLISHETGKPFWETKTEAAAVAGKVDISIRAYHERTGEVETATGATRGVFRHRPHGVFGVLGPFNFPAHLPNGHIVPALLAGNTIVAKPSELTPGPLAFLVRSFAEAGLPKGVLNLVQGERDVGEALAKHDGLDGLLFTGGARTGRILQKMYAEKPGKILALELGGNNPLVWWDTEDIDAAAYTVLQSAFLTAGQRCTCARRLIIPDTDIGDAYIDSLMALCERVLIDGPFTDPQPFMGPVINAQVAARLERAFDARVEMGGAPLRNLSVQEEGSAFVSIGIIDMTDVDLRRDDEQFGPLLHVYRVPDFDLAMKEANATSFGLSAGLLSDSPQNWEVFRTFIRAGIVNWNRQTTGASSAAPFGGIGDSGNHRPSAYYAADYCAYPVASMEGNTLLPQPENSIGLKNQFD